MSSNSPQQQSTRKSSSPGRPARDRPGRGDDRPTNAGYHCESVAGDDRLGIDTEAEAFARLMMDAQIRPPLSVGLLGDWGSGKSFFMERIRHLVTSLQGAPGQCDHVAQIRFNAWHFSDANLWASLVTHIFDEVWKEVAPSEPNSLEAQEALRVSLESARGAVHEAGARLAGAREALQRAQEDLSRKQERLALEGYVDHRRRQALEAVARTVGWDKPLENIAEVRGALAELHQAEGRLTLLMGAATRGNALGAALPWILLSVLVGAGLTVAGEFQGTDWVKHALHSVGLLGGLVASAVSAVAVPLRQASKRLAGLAGELEQVQTDYDAKLAAQKKSDDPRQQALAEARQQAELELQSASASLAAAQKNLAAVMARHDELDPARRLGAFLAERAAAQDYRARQGIVSLVRRDFARLSELMGQWRQGGGGEAPGGIRPVERIVLYVDDLDRCPPYQVVQALEAIHLLLALDLFVVVVAVDSRWLLRSLAVHYSELLNTTGETSEAYRESTPQNYLEKIFQVTYALAPMQEADFGTYLEHLAALPGELPAEPRAPAGASLKPRPLTITNHERQFLTGLLPLIPTPRMAKRMVNVYRLIKARVPPQDVAAFEDTDSGRYRPVLLLLALLFGRPRQAEELLRRLCQKEPPFQTPMLQLHLAVKNLAQAEGQDEQVHDAWIQLGHVLEKLAGDLLVEQCTPEAGELARYSLVTGQTCHLW